ncbi:MAG: hypothetical protein IPP59_09545 [Betaproteobacteria bacterium]|nr:hypothetical protein [Candidatus Dechloromonas phosphorivorans]
MPEGRTLVWQIVNSAQTPEAVKGKLQTAPAQNFMLRIQTHAVCGLPNTRGQNAAPEGQFQTVRAFVRKSSEKLAVELINTTLPLA